VELPKHSEYIYRQFLCKTYGHQLLCVGRVNVDYNNMDHVFKWDIRDEKFGEMYYLLPM